MEIIIWDSLMISAASFINNMVRRGSFSAPSLTPPPTYRGAFRVPLILSQTDLPADFGFVGGFDSSGKRGDSLFRCGRYKNEHRLVKLLWREEDMPDSCSIMA